MLPEGQWRIVKEITSEASSVDYGYAVSNFSWNTSKETLTSLLSWENIDLRSMHKATHTHVLLCIIGVGKGGKAV
jgi:hypothetical protein